MKSDYERLGRYFIIPYFLFEGKYKKLSVSAKLLYGLFLNRHSLSRKNKANWTDELGYIYFVFTMAEIRSWLGCSNNKAINTVDELVAYNLLIRRKDKRGTANRFYLLESSLASEPDQSLNAT